MPRTLLVVSAHSADFVWRAAGAIATVVDGGRRRRTSSRSRTASAASRASCGRRPGQTEERVKEIRHGEALAAATTLGASFRASTSATTRSSSTPPRSTG